MDRSHRIAHSIEHGRFNYCGVRCSPTNPYPRGTQLHTLFALFRKNRGKWVSMRTLNLICFRYGARLYNLRNDGAIIERKQHLPSGAFLYRCTRLPRKTV